MARLAAVRLGQRHQRDHLEADPQCVAARLTRRYGPRYGYLYKFGAVVGYAWIQDVHRGAFTRKADMRTQIIALAAGDLMVYKLPKHVNLDNVTVEYGAAKESFLTDGGNLRMDIMDRMRSS